MRVLSSNLNKFNRTRLGRSSILTVKLADINAVKFKPSSELLKKAKGATWDYNKQHMQKK